MRQYLIGLLGHDGVEELVDGVQNERDEATLVLACGLKKHTPTIRTNTQ